MVHPENVLLAILSDHEQSIRAEVVRLIRRLRERRSQQPVHRFHKSGVNFGARHFTELTDVWEAAAAADIGPPYCQLLDDSQLEVCLATPLVIGIPSNTQSAERAVRLTTEAAAAAVSGTVRQDDLSLNKIAFRSRCPGQITNSTFSVLRK